MEDTGGGRSAPQNQAVQAATAKKGDVPRPEEKPVSKISTPSILFALSF